MIELFRDLPHYVFLQYALITAVLASIACGLIGPYVVVRRITYIAGGIAHSVLGGLGAAVYLESVHGVTWLHPIYGAVAAALLAAVIIGMVSLRARQREDTVIGAVWAIGMAAGVIFIWQTPGYSADLMTYLFGSILMVSSQDLWLLAGLDVLIIAVTFLFYHQFLAVCFDEEFARIRGINTEFYYLLLLCLIALTVVLLVTVVGIVLVIALLTLPAAIAGFFAHTLRQMMLLATLLSLFFTVGGLAFSYQPDLPAGVTTVLIAGAAYLIVVIGRRIGFRRSG